jgi:phosphonate transport system permease protein
MEGLRVAGIAAASPARRAFERAEAELARSRRRQWCWGGAAFLVALGASIRVGEVSLEQFAKGLPGIFAYAHETLPTLRLASLASDLAEWYWGLGKWLAALWDTVIIAVLGTLLGAAGAFLLSFPAARNLGRMPAVSFAARRLGEVARAVPELVYALIFVFAFGLGPLPGVLAIAVHSAGALGKLFAEVNESVSQGPLEAVRACGGNWVQVIRFGVVPQVLPNFLSYALLRLEINVRSASVIGFVGAGGLGQELMFVIRQFVYQDVSAIVVLILATVSALDIACERVRHAVIGQEALR